MFGFLSYKHVPTLCYTGRRPHEWFQVGHTRKLNDHVSPRGETPTRGISGAVFFSVRLSSTKKWSQVGPEKRGAKKQLGDGSNIASFGSSREKQKCFGPIIVKITDTAWVTTKLWFINSMCEFRQKKGNLKWKTFAEMRLQNLNWSLLYHKFCLWWENKKVWLKKSFKIEYAKWF